LKQGASGSCLLSAEIRRIRKKKKKADFEGWGMLQGRALDLQSPVPQKYCDFG
jgi:hypothetical protein